ncbi:ABC transporter substrate-binding protein [Subtercola frigoramans]|uniref:Peptide/nickel transport system substrate-binding protein n=1 Tax=Subtercola frigoramans TaxID=120298 RepID=A0ABS2LAC3_9MICO|nr:ABC transporter substrate-binding protein [Subtercola frigoramans]MBM7473705.1 peptide/nickel transport system substrate-binding protein [Subtercola frigoramans]
MFRWKATAAALAVVALTLSGCAATDDSTNTASPSLVISTIIAPNSFSTTQAEWGNRSLFYQSVYDTLLLQTAEGTIEPFLATSYTYNSDNTVLTLAIRDDVNFTDGTHLTAGIVKQNLDRFKSGGGPYSTDLLNVASVDAPDDKTIVITLSQPDPAMVSYLAKEAGLVESPATFDAADAATNPIGSGPYVLDTASTVTGTSYVFTKNPKYWNPDLQHYDKLTIKVISDPTAAVNAIKAGEANAVRLPNSLNFPEVEAAGWSLNLNELDFEGLLLLDRAGTQNPALADVRVRQAINYAIDRPGLLQALQQGNGDVTTQVFKATSAAYDPALDNAYPFDTSKAKALLAQAGYANGLTISMPSTVVLGATSFSIIAQQLADVGITVQYTDTAPENYISDMVAPKYPAVFMALEQNPDWQLIQFMLSPTATFNPFKSSDATTEELISAIQHGDTATQAAKAKELNTYIVDQAWFAPFFRVKSSFASDAQTSVTVMPTNASPAIYDFKPKG